MSIQVTTLGGEKLPEGKTYSSIYDRRERVLIINPIHDGVILLLEKRMRQDQEQKRLEEEFRKGSNSGVTQYIGKEGIRYARKK